MTEEELKSSIKALETANEQYNKNYYDNEHLIRKYQWELWYANIHKKQIEIINEALIKISSYLYLAQEEPLKKGTVDFMKNLELKDLH